MDCLLIFFLKSLFPLLSVKDMHRVAVMLDNTEKVISVQIQFK